MMRIHIVNPGGNMAGKKRKKRTSNPKRRRRRNPAAPVVAAMNPSRRRRRRRNPSVVAMNPRRRRRRNPESGDLKSFFGKWAPSGKTILLALGADLVIGLAVRRFGDTWGTGIMGQAATSPYAGQGWSIKNYAVAAGALFLVNRFFVRSRFGEDGSRAFVTAGITQLARRMMYTEVLARSQWAQDTFGQVVPVYDDMEGQRWAQTQDGSWYAMQGTLVQASPMGGALVQASPMGRRFHGLRPARVLDRSLTPGNVADEGGRFSTPTPVRYRSNWGQGLTV